MDTKKELILKSALTFFARYGYRKTTIEDIASRADMTPGNIYFYVKNKKSLYHETIRYGLSGWRDYVAEKITESGNPVERFKVMAVQAFEYLKNNDDLRNIIANDPGIFTLSEEEDAFKDINHGAIELLQDVLRDGIAQGFFRHVDVLHSSEFLFSVYIMFIIKSYVKSGSNCPDTMFLQALDICISGLLNRDAGHLKM